MSVYSVVSPFRQLLNQISHDLTSQNLRSLMHMCGNHVSENRRENIRCGLDLFECLIHCNIIGEDLGLMRNLLSLMRDMRPKRKDIIRTVKKHIREHYDPPWGFESSVESSFQSTTRTDVPVVEQPRSPLHPHPPTYEESSGLSTPLISHSNDQYSWCCICFDCNCIPRPVPSCVLVIGFIVFAVLTIIVTIIWFAEIPSVINRLGEGKHPAVGASIVAISALFSLVFLIVFIVRKVEHMRARRQYHMPSINRAIASSAENITVTSGSISSLPVDTTVKRYKPKRRRSGRSSLPTGSETSHVVDIPPVAIPSRQANTQLSYPDGCHDNITDEDGTSGNIASQSDFYSGEESEVMTVAVSG